MMEASISSVKLLFSHITYYMFILLTNFEISFSQENEMVLLLLHSVRTTLLEMKR